MFHSDDKMSGNEKLLLLSWGWCISYTDLDNNLLIIKRKIMSHCFWAEFIEIGTDIFRFDTRIYFHPVNSINVNDHCIGAVVGKNPGSAKSTVVGQGIQPIELDGDKLLPIVRNIITKSFDQSGTHLPENGYIQVLNLFYLCNPNLGQAIMEPEVSRFLKSLIPLLIRGGYLTQGLRRLWQTPI